METYATVKDKLLFLPNCGGNTGSRPVRRSMCSIAAAIILKPVNEESLRRLQGSLKGKGVLKWLMEERRKDVDRE